MIRRIATNRRNQLPYFGLFSNRCRSFASSTNKNENRSVLVTGSTAGIGLIMAQDFASKGYYVIITGFGDSDGALSQVRKSAVETGFDSNRIEFIGANLGVRQECIDLFEKSAQFVSQKTNQKDGYVNVLINNAGFQHVSNIANFPLDIFDEMQKVMYLGPYYLMQQWILRLNNMSDNDKYGRLINIASVHGKIASKNKSSYIGAKHGLIGFTKTAALELATEFPDHNVTANAICPGFIETELVVKQVEQRMEASGADYATEAYNLVSEKMPTGKFVQPRDIAKLVEYLCCEEARQVTGTTMTIDGAWSTQ